MRKRKQPFLTKFIFTIILLCVLSTRVYMLSAQDSIKYFTIRVIDSKTGRGVPLVEFKTSSRQCYYTDSRGIIAFDEPTLMNQMVSFNVFSHGYECPKDGLILNTIPGTSKVIKIKRLNIAERLYRITGQDIYGQSIRLGLPSPIKHQALNGKVMGQDTYIETLYKGKLYWFWGDTELPAGFNGEASGATSELPEKGGLDPGVGIDLTYFVDDNGLCKHICPFQGQTLVWIQWLVTLNDEKGNERLYASYNRINSDDNPGEAGIAVFNDSTDTFDRIKVIDAWYGKTHCSGHPFIVRTEGQDYIYIINHPGIARVRADIRFLTDPASYEQFTCFAPISLQDTSSPILERDATNRLVYGWKSNASPLNHRQQKIMVDSRKMSAEEGLWQLQDIETGNAISVDPASVFWNDYRKRWVMIAYEFVGGVWFFEGDTPTGPWVYGRKIVSHDNYDFYNVGQHPLFDQDGGRLIYFEGTYTKGFSSNTNVTPLYDYNQMMYRLALDDYRLSLPEPVYLVKNESKGEQYLMREGIDSLDLWEKIQGIPFFALPVSKRNIEAIPIYASKSRQGTILTTSPRSSNETRPLFYALPSVAKPRSQSDPITGTWKCKALMPDSSYAEFDLSLEKEGEDVTGSNEAEGHFRNDTLTLSFRIFDYSLTGQLQGGKLIGEYRKDDGTELGNWTGISPELNKEEPVPSSIVFLYEYRKVGNEEIFYSIDPGLASSLITRTAQPVCRVWRNPSSVIALDYKAKPVQLREKMKLN
jgi:hypothetical protein